MWRELQLAVEGAQAPGGAMHAAEPCWREGPPLSHRRSSGDASPHLGAFLFGDAPAVRASALLRSLRIACLEPKSQAVSHVPEAWVAISAATRLTP